MRWICFLLAVLMGGSAWGASPRDALESVVDWSELDAVQGLLSEEEFVDALERVYAPGERWRPWVRLGFLGAWIIKDAENPEDEYFYRFRSDGVEARPARLKRGGGLSGLRIALDPGHIGGRWADVEERSFRVGDGLWVKEGDITLATARRLKRLLAGKGVEVWLTRESDESASGFSPDDFIPEAKRRLGEAGGSGGALYQVLANRLYIRNADIRARAEELNTKTRPDLTLALHVNAMAWPDPEVHSLVDENNLHILVNGTYLPSELADDAQRFELFYRLAQRYHAVEFPLAVEAAAAFREAMGLAPYLYEGGNATALDEGRYVWSRNLLANRIFRSPVIYYEPWVANSAAVYDWAAAGDYEGAKVIDGVSRLSLPAVYADLVMVGLERYFGGEDG